MSASHFRNQFDHLERFLRFQTVVSGEPASEINATMLIDYRGSLDRRHEWHLGVLSGLLRKWHALQLPGVTDDAVALLKRLRVKGNQKGEAILTMDPETGPFTDIELQSILAALDDAHARGDVSLENYVLSWLFALLGQRPVQYASLKVGDLRIGQSSDGAVSYLLQIPRAKQRSGLSRGAFKERIVVKQIAEKLAEHARQVRAAFSDVIANPDDAPLFPTRANRKTEPDGFQYHRTATSIGKAMATTLQSLGVTSERTGRLLHITAIRFRRTVGTRAALEGHGELVIAELLDHTDTQNVGVYVQATPQIIERIDRAVAMQLAPLAQAFAGAIIADESEAVRAGDPTSRIYDPRFDASMRPMGNCGSHAFCSLMAPIACYTCRSFQPWCDGPHEAVLDFLLAERERLLAESDIRIAAINDRTILAVAAVIRQCGELQEAQEVTEHD